MIYEANTLIARKSPHIDHFPVPPDQHHIRATSTCGQWTSAGEFAGQRCRLATGYSGDVARYWSPPEPHPFVGRQPSAPANWPTRLPLQERDQYAQPNGRGRTHSGIRLQELCEASDFPSACRRAYEVEQRTGLDSPRYQHLGTPRQKVSFDHRGQGNPPYTYQPQLTEVWIRTFLTSNISCWEYCP